MSRGRAAGFCLVALLAGVGCSDETRPPGGEPGGGGGAGGADPAELLSADGWRSREEAPWDRIAGGGTGGSEELMGSGGAGGAGPLPRVQTRERGERARWLAPGRLALLDPNSGLTVVDVSDPALPVAVGRYEPWGTPLELWVVGTTAYLLLEGRYEFAVPGGDRHAGGVIQTVDLANPGAPRLVAELRVRGSIRASQLFPTAEGGTLVVVSHAVRHAGEPGVGYTTSLQSFLSSPGGALVEAASITQPGYVTAVKADADGLALVRHHVEQRWDSALSLVHVDAATGSLSSSAPLPGASQILWSGLLDRRGPIVRVIWPTGPMAGSADFSDPAHPVWLERVGLPRADVTAVAWQAEHAFVALAWSREGSLQSLGFDAAGAVDGLALLPVPEVPALDALVSVHGGRRLLGVGPPPLGSHAGELQLSLWEVADPVAPRLLATALAGEPGSGGGEATFDARAITVLEGSVELLAPDGTSETGLALLPSEGWDPAGEPLAGVQLFSFSSTTLTRRGAIATDASIRRTLPSGGGVEVALSEEGILCFADGAPEEPRVLGGLLLSADRAALRPLDDAVARLTLRNLPSPPPRSFPIQSGATLELLPSGAALDGPGTLGELELPRGAWLVQTPAGLTALSVRDELIDWTNVPRTTVQTLSLATAAAPGVEGTFDTLELPAVEVGEASQRSSRQADYFGPSGVFPVGEALVFAAQVPGGWTLRVVDLRDRQAPALGGTIPLPPGRTLRKLEVIDGALWLSTVEPAGADAAGRALVRWFAQPIVLDDPAAPVLGEELALPGELLALDATHIVTLDFVWRDAGAEGSLRLLERTEAGLRPLAQQSFPGEDVEEVLRLGDDVLVLHRLTQAERERQGIAFEALPRRLDAFARDTLAPRTGLDVSPWVSGLRVEAGRALLAVPDGVLVVSLEGDGAPLVQAHLPASIRGHLVRVGARLVWVGGRRGLRSFTQDEVLGPPR